MIKPFTVHIEKSNTEDFIKPFTVGGDHVQVKEQEPQTGNNEKQTKTEKKELKEVKPIPVQVQMVRPLDYIPEDVAKIAEQISMGDRKLSRILAEGMHQYMAEGGDMQQLIRRAKENKKPEGFNFQLELKKMISRIFDSSEGEIRDSYYGIEITVYKANGKAKSFYTEIESDKVKEYGWLKRATHSLAMLPRTKDDKETLDNMIQECIESEDAKPEWIYNRAGWRNITGSGWRYIFRDGMVGNQGSQIHTGSGFYTLTLRSDKIGDQEVFQAAMMAADICENKRTSMNLLLFMHMGLLTTLFQQAGYDIDFSFMIVGPTNCRKTSLVTAIAKVFDRDRLKADAEFATATSAGIEQTLGLYKDATVIIDDYKAGANLTQQREMNRKLDELIRFYGDRVEKKRMLIFTHNGERIYFPIGGNCVITGEFAPEAIESSMTRLFLTEVNKNDVDNIKLRRYQEERWIIPTHAYDFVQWVTGRFETCVQYISENYSSYRDQKHYSVGRFSNMYAAFMITADLISMYALERGFWNSEDQGRFFQAVQTGLEIELDIMEERFRQRDKATQVLRVCKEALDSKQITPVQLNRDSCGRGEELYEDSRCYYVTTRFLRMVIKQYGTAYSDTQRIINNEDLIAVLDRKEALEVVEKDGKRIRSRKLPIQRGNTKRYLYLKKESLEHLDEE